VPNIKIEPVTVSGKPVHDNPDEVVPKINVSISPNAVLKNSPVPSWLVAVSTVPPNVRNVPAPPLPMPFTGFADVARGKNIGNTAEDVAAATAPTTNNATNATPSMLSNRISTHLLY
jgi:hypothetical protein